MGIYQVSPGDPTYALGKPLFDRVTLKLENGKTFTISTSGNTPQNRYVQQVQLNGNMVLVPFISHSDILSGGELRFTLGPGHP
jgi:putative alpha-1,2-mannosidase